jgi:hypothetical protein
MTRDEILNEFRRTAAENGGKPLGRGRFVETTGITEYEILGHWPNWSAAVQEAGLEPNTLNPAYDEDFLMAKYIGFVL